MFYRPNNLVPDRIRSNPTDVAPMIFCIDVISSDQYTNPVIPVPVRIDKISNGEYTYIVLPNMQPQAIIDNSVYYFDLYRFLELGFRNLLAYSAKKFQEITYRPLNPINVSKWWEDTRNHTCNIPSYTEDITICLQAYLDAYQHWKLSGDMRGALIQYSEKIIDLCTTRLQSNTITYQRGKTVIKSRMFTERRDGKKLPQIWEVDHINTSNGKVRKRAFIPLMIYDDLLECFLSNKAELERGELEIIDFASLEKLKVLGNHLIGINDHFYAIELSSPKFDKILVGR